MRPLSIFLKHREFFEHEDLLKTYMNSNLFDKSKDKQKLSDQDDDEVSDGDMEEDVNCF